MSDPASTPAGQADNKNATPPAAGGDTKKEPENKAEGEAPLSMLGPNGEKQEGGQPADDKGKPGQSDSAGELEIKLPDGFKADDAALAWFKGVAKEVGLNSESASRFVAAYITRATEEAKAYESAWKKQGDDWAASIKADKELGGAKLPETQSAIGKAMAKFGSAELAKELEDRGLSNHPGLVKFFASVGKAMKEDDSSTGGGKPGAAKESADESFQRRWPVTYAQDQARKAAGGR